MNTVYGTECSAQIVHDKLKARVHRSNPNALNRALTASSWNDEAIQQAFLVVGSVGWLHLRAMYELNWPCKQFILPVCCQTLLAPVTHARRMRVTCTVLSVSAACIKQQAVHVHSSVHASFGA